MLLLCNNNNYIEYFCLKYVVDAIEQNALSRRVSGLSGGGGGAQSAAGRWFMVQLGASSIGGGGG